MMCLCINDDVEDDDDEYDIHVDNDDKDDVINRQLKPQQIVTVFEMSL